IDDGLAFANERFCTYNAGVRASRIESFWGQDLAPNPKYGYGASSGHVFPRVAIDQLLQDALVGNAVDEDRLYQLAGYSFGVPGHKSTARRAAHGTHVMDLACGFDPLDPTGLKRRIVAVQLPTIVTEQTSGLLLRLYVVKAVWHIMLTALSLSTATNKVPVVINLSYGMTSGPHDGTGAVELALDQLVSLFTAFGMRLTIVVPAGNSHLTRVHATAALPAGLPIVPVQWSWRALPDDRTPSFLEVWMPCNASFNEIQLEVETPTGDRSGRITEGTGWLWSKGRQRALVLYPGFQSLGSRRMALVVLWPTASIDRNAPLTSPSGTWKVYLYNTGSQPRVVDGRVMRDDNAFGFPIVGRQARFEDHNYARFGSFGLPLRRDPGGSVVVRAGSINGLATGARTVVVGGCRASDLYVVPYSGAGPAERPQGCGMATRLGPDVLAPCETSVGHGGILAGGTRSNSTIAMHGTSVAAPQVTRVLANHLETYGVGDRTTIWWEAVLQVTNRYALGWVPPLAGWPAPDDGFGQVEVPNGALPAANARRPPQYRP
ncbi:MAG: S8 family serine peptidase, partial [Burkholderiales bacterium]|nr:S8 family serine peptidase [Burkholderiales bacterium]